MALTDFVAPTPEGRNVFRPSGVGLGLAVEIELSLSLRFSGAHSGQRLLAA
jgi:hypothetical protein